MKNPEGISVNDWKLLQRKYKDLDKIIKKLKENYPVQYLIGDVDFYGYRIIVNESVLIPRFETETLVEKTINYLDKLSLKQSSLLEIGTGSGCISITLKSEVSSLEITAIDISRKALTVAKKNAKLNKTKITFINKDMFKFKTINKYDILISNPPYIKENEEIDPKTKYEPSNALYAGNDGLKYYHQIFEIAVNSLNPKHLIALEIGEEQGKVLKQLAKKYFKKDTISLEQDLAGKDRYLFIYHE